jgi:hypothetical protein
MRHGYKHEAGPWIMRDCGQMPILFSYANAVNLVAGYAESRGQASWRSWKELVEGLAWDAAPNALTVIKYALSLPRYLQRGTTGCKRNMMARSNGSRPGGMIQDDGSPNKFHREASRLRFKTMYRTAKTRIQTLVIWCVASFESFGLRMERMLTLQNDVVDTMEPCHSADRPGQSSTTAYGMDTSMDYQDELDDSSDGRQSPEDDDEAGYGSCGRVDEMMESNLETDYKPVSHSII